MLRLGCVHHFRTAPGNGTHCSFSRGGGTCCRTSRSQRCSHINVLSACRVMVKETVTTVEPSEVVATAAESLKVSVVSTDQLFVCPVAARRAVPELPYCRSYGRHLRILVLSCHGYGGHLRILVLCCRGYRGCL